jgi:hypothetical protein
MKQYAKLEIRLDRWDVASYAVEMVLRLPGSDAPSNMLEEPAPPIQITPSEFTKQEYLGNYQKYGAALSQCLFDRRKTPEQPTVLSQAWVKARSESNGEPLRVVLHLGSGAQDLHRLHWEKLTDPAGQDLLAPGEQVYFSRFLSSGSTMGIRPLGKAELRALAVVANPEDLEDWSPGNQPLPRLEDVEGMLEMIKTSLGGIRMDSIPDDPVAGGERATLTRLITSLQKGYDILYLVCHGVFKETEPVLYLEDDKAQTTPISGFELIRRLSECLQLPRLVVLASCQSAGRGEGGENGGNNALAALGPRLVEAGVPAVLAMQGNITIETVEQFMPVFFRELAQQGQIDRAVAIARSQVRDRSDWWAPALFMRLESGALWYEPGFKDKPLKKWPALLNSIKNKRCTPVVGLGLAEPVLGCCREIARTWATKYNYPLARYQEEDLPQVAQYLCIAQDSYNLQDELKDYWRNAILKRFGDRLPAEMRNEEIIRLEALQPMISAAGKLSRESEYEPHRVLAEMPFTTYISANPTSLLTDALKDAGRTPQVFFYRWREVLFEPVELSEDPTEQEPLVYQLFGSLEDPDSLVLTMDDYFDYLIAISKNMAKAKGPIPKEVITALTDKALMLLGFQLDDWNFWVLFRFLMNLEGGRGKKQSNVAVQIRPEVGRFRIPEDASTYLEDYFLKGSKPINMNIYWGSSQEFIKDLERNWGGMGQ